MTAWAWLVVCALIVTAQYLVARAATEQRARYEREEKH